MYNQQKIIHPSKLKNEITFYKRYILIPYKILKYTKLLLFSHYVLDDNDGEWNGKYFGGMIAELRKISKFYDENRRN